MEASVRPANVLEENIMAQTISEHPFIIPDPTAAPTSGVGPSPALIPPLEPGPADSSSTTTLPRLASVRVSNNGSPEENERPGLNVLQGAGDNTEPTLERRSSASFSATSIRYDNMAEHEVVVLTPSRLRLDSRVVLGHATLQWLTNVLWALFIWRKLEHRLDWSWWAVFSPTIVNHALHIPMQILVLLSANHMIYKQIGPPPPLNASPGLVLQYAIIHHVRVRSHRVDWANNTLESVAIFIAKMLFCDALERNVLHATSLRLIFTPIWVCWVMTVALLCLKDRSERMFGSSRDLFFMFLLFVAFKADDQRGWTKVPWRVVFLVPWMWFSGLLLVAALVMLLLIFAKVWARPRELLLPIGFLCLLLSTVPQFLSYIALVRRLDDEGGNTSIASIMWPNALSWLLMWLSALLIAWSLRQKELLRDVLLARGAVWTAHEAVARRLHAEREEAQRRVDELSEDEVSRLVATMMVGKKKPGRLRRVGENLYKRIASLEPALAEQAAQNAVQAVASEGAAPTTEPDPAWSCSRPQSMSQQPLSRSSSAAVVAAVVGVHPQPSVSGSGTAHGPGRGPGGLLAMKHNRVVPGGGGGEGPPLAAAGAAAAGGLLVAGPTRSGRWLVASELAAGRGTGAVVAAEMVGGEQSSPAARGVAQACPPGVVGDVELQRVADVESAASAIGAGASGLGVPPERTPNRQQQPQQQQQQRRRESAVALRNPATNTNTSTTTHQGTRGGNGGDDLAVVAAAAVPETAAVAELVVATAATTTADSRAPPRPPSCSRRLRLAPMPSLLSPALPSEERSAEGSAVAAAAAARPPSAAPTQGSLQRQRGLLEPPGRASAGAMTAVATATAAGSGDGLTSGGAAVAGAGVSTRDSSGGSADAAGGGPRVSAAGARETATATAAPERGSRGGSCSNAGEAALPGTAVSLPAAAVTPATPSSASVSPRRSPAVLPPAEADGENAAEAEAAVLPAGADAAATSANAGSASNEGLHQPQVDGAARGHAQDKPDSNDGGGIGKSAAGSSSPAAASSSSDPENACVICYDNEATCVFLECGHGGFCRRCAFLLFVRPPNECPTCRQLIDQVVEIEAVTPVGEVALVKLA